MQTILRMQSTIKQKKKKKGPKIQPIGGEREPHGEAMKRRAAHLGERRRSRRRRRRSRRGAPARTCRTWGTAPALSSPPQPRPRPLPFPAAGSHPHQHQHTLLFLRGDRHRRRIKAKGTNAPRTSTKAPKPKKIKNAKSERSRGAKPRYPQPRAENRDEALSGGHWRRLVVRREKKKRGKRSKERAAV